MTIAARFRVDYGGFALDVDLSLPAAGVSAVFGHSGSGKTTLLRAIAGLERVPGGRLAVGDLVWQDGETFVPPHRRALGYVFQEASLFPHLSVRGNLDYGRRRAAGAGSVDFDGIVGLLGIDHLLQRRPERLSGGERGRVAIARALLAAPRVLLLDEPLAALDAPRKAELLPYLERLHRELAIPVLYVTHAVDEVARLADHLVVLEGGRVAASGPVGELMARADLAISRGDDASALIDGRVGAEDEAYHLTRIDSAAGYLWVAQLALPVGSPVRLRVLARDVSLALSAPRETSILNLLPAQVTSVAADGPGRALVGLRAGEQPLMARVTEKSVALLGLAPGLPVIAQIKGVAVLR